MIKEEIQQLLQDKHHELFTLLLQNSNEFWMKNVEQKWTVGQHVLHLYTSIKLVNKALKYPKLILKFKFGVSNRPSRTYEHVVKRYQEKLVQYQDKAQEFNQHLRIPEMNEKDKLISQLSIENKKLQKATHIWSDKNLNTLLIPHPLMGKMTVREIIMWTAYHTEHHTRIIQEYYT